MGRDYPVERTLDRLYESGFARRERFRAGSRTEVLIPASDMLTRSINSDGQGLDVDDAHRRVDG